MPASMLARFAMLPELNLTWVEHKFPNIMILHAHKVSRFEVCPKCANKSHSIYDRRVVQVKDEPIRRQHVVLRINKRRFYCKPCRKPFTEPVPGIGKGRRYSERFKKALLWACETFSDIKSVRRNFNCSYSFVCKSLYEVLKTQAGHNTGQWPTKIGIDEHCFGRDSKTGQTRFATFFVSHSRNKRAFEIVEGRTTGDPIPEG